MRFRIAVGVVLLLALFVVLSPASTAQRESSCVTCHTDEAALKKLCKIPEIPTGEAEG